MLWMTKCRRIINKEIWTQINGGRQYTLHPSLKTIRCFCGEIVRIDSYEWKQKKWCVYVVGEKSNKAIIEGSLWMVFHLYIFEMGALYNIWFHYFSWQIIFNLLDVQEAYGFCLNAID